MSEPTAFGADMIEVMTDAMVGAIIDAGGTIDYRVQPVARASLTAAIAKLREPTPEMIDAAGKALKGYIEALSPDERASKTSWRGYEVGWREKMTARWIAMLSRLEVEIGAEEKGE